MIVAFQGKHPRIHETAFVAGDVIIIGDVEIGAGVNIWFHSLLRGDVNSIRVGAGCNIQDGSILHVGRDRFPLILEEDVVMGHRVTVHGCRIGRGAMVGIGAIVLDGASIGEEALVGAGAVVPPGAVVPARSLVLGAPAKPVRELTERDLAMIHRTRENYRSLMEIYRGIPFP